MCVSLHVMWLCQVPRYDFVIMCPSSGVYGCRARMPPFNLSESGSFTTDHNFKSRCLVLGFSPLLRWSRLCCNARQGRGTHRRTQCFCSLYSVCTRAACSLGRSFLVYIHIRRGTASSGTDVHLRPVALIITISRPRVLLHCTSFARNLGRGVSHFCISLHL